MNEMSRILEIQVHACSFHKHSANSEAEKTSPKWHWTLRRQKKQHTHSSNGSIGLTFWSLHGNKRHQFGDRYLFNLSQVKQ